MTAMHELIMSHVYVIVEDIERDDEGLMAAVGGLFSAYTGCTITCVAGCLKRVLRSTTYERKYRYGGSDVSVDRGPLRTVAYRGGRLVGGARGVSTGGWHGRCAR